MRDGFMNVNGNQGGKVNYEPNSLNGPVEDHSKKWSEQKVSGTTGRFKYTHPNNDHE
jgi:catalase